ncbi:MAG: ABC transporter transmembrane domain-containing protein, partial [Lachnospiraceae bacterium]|nr:ABC transporter transmembrane domain-containing protein [Lachnospiraceae bacterium]
MIQTFQTIWAFSQKRHTPLKKALACSFFRSAFSGTQMFAVMLALRVFFENVPVKKSVFQIALLAAFCVTGNFLTSYLEQIGTMEMGFFMAADKRVSLGNLLRRAPLGFFSDSSVGRITATLTTTLSNVENTAVMAMVGIVSGLFSASVFFLFVLFYDWRIGVLTGCGIAVYLCVVNWQMGVSRKQAPALQAAQSRLAAAVTFLQGIKVTKAFCFQEGDRKLKEAVQGSCDANIRLTGRSMPSQFAARLV